MQIDLVTSIVVYHPNFDVLSRTTDSVRASSIPSRLIIVDNGLEDRVRDFAITIGAEYIRPSDNLGYGTAHNLAIRKYAAKSKYHLILNPDVKIHEGCLEELVHLMDSDNKIVLSTAKVLNDDGSLQRVHKRLPSFKLLFGRRFSPKLFNFLWPQEFSRYELHDIDLDQYLVLPNVSGCFMLFRSDILAKIDGFDERYFMYQEDVDLSRRAREQGLVVYSPNAVITHSWARGSHKKLKLTVMNIVSALKYFLKWAGKPPDNSIEVYSRS